MGGNKGASLRRRGRELIPKTREKARPQKRGECKLKLLLTKTRHYWKEKIEGQHWRGGSVKIETRRSISFIPESGIKSRAFFKVEKDPKKKPSKEKKKNSIPGEIR